MSTKLISFQTPPPILQKIEQCRLKRTKHLNLSGGTAFGQIMLPRVPPEIFTLTHLEELDLSHHGIQVIPEEIKQLKHLKKLDLRGNPLRQVADVWGLFLHYADVKRLKLSPEHIVGLKLTLFSYEAPEDIFDFPHLVALDMSRHPLKQLPEWIFNLKNLTSLDLSFNQLSCLKGLKQLVHLIYLDLSFNQLSNLEGLEELPHLVSLNLNFNQLNSLKGLRQLPHLTSLSLRYNKLNKLEDLDIPLHLTSLDLSHNQFTNLKNLIPLAHLTSLNVSSNQIQNLEDISFLVHLTSLNVSNNQLNDLTGLKQLVRLVYLNLSFNQLNCLKGLEQLLHLTFLNLSHNSFSNLNDLEKLVHLASLDLSHNPLNDLRSIRQFIRLTFLNVSHNRLKNLESIGQLIHLVSLNASHNQLKSLNGLESLSHLASLNVSHNSLKNLRGIEKLLHLTALNVSHNQLRHLKNLEQLMHLTYLDSSHNRLKSLENIGPLFRLSSLNVSHNHLDCLEDLEGLIHLNSLNVSHNQLNRLEGLEQATYLTALNVSHNHLNNLEYIEQLPYLTSLYFTDNPLSNPKGMEYLVHLTSLYLSHNQLECLEGIEYLIHLNSVNLGFNPLHLLPDNLFALPKLEHLALEGCSTIHPPMEELEIERSGEDANLLRVRNYLRELNEKNYLYETKLLIVGKRRAGETSLARKIQDPHHGEHHTKGIDIIRWQFPWDTEYTYRVNIWDLSGQEAYPMIHPLFFTKRTLYLLVTDSHQKDIDIDYWLNMIALFSDNPPLLVVNDEKDKYHFEFNESELKKQLNHLEDFYPIHLNAPHQNFEQLVEMLLSYLKHRQHIAEPLPKSWLQVKQALETDERNEITLDEFLTLCEYYGLKSHKDKLKLSETLHDLGSVLHFQTDPLLSPILFLKPHWVMQSIAHVLGHPRVKNTLDQLNQENLTPLGYESQNLHDHLLPLMFKFKLCYPLKSSPNTYIVPQFLSPIQPSYPWESQENCIVFYKNYAFMPKGLLAPLIVALHEHIAHQQQYVWRSGVVLEKDATQAEITEHYKSQELRIKVVGQNKRMMMTLIMCELQQIHDHYKRLSYEIWLPCHCEAFKTSPEFFKYDELKHFVRHRQRIQCRKCFKRLNPLHLLEEVLDFNEVERMKKTGHINHCYSTQSFNKGTIINVENPFKRSWAWGGLFYLILVHSIIIPLGVMTGTIVIDSLLVVIEGILLILLVGILQLPKNLEETSFTKLVGFLTHQFSWGRGIVKNRTDQKK